MEREKNFYKKDERKERKKKERKKERERKGKREQSTRSLTLPVAANLKLRIIINYCYTLIPN